MPLFHGDLPILECAKRCNNSGDRFLFASLIFLRVSSEHLYPSLAARIFAFLSSVQCTPFPGSPPEDVLYPYSRSFDFNNAINSISTCFASSCVRLSYSISCLKFSQPYFLIALVKCALFKYPFPLLPHLALGFRAVMPT